MNYPLTRGIPRRSLLKAVGLGALALGTVPALNACTSTGLRTASDVSASAQTIKIGYVSPRTGPLAAFTESDPFILAQVREYFGKGLTAGGTVYQVEILDRDTGSDSQQAASIADELISQQNVDLMLVTAAPETVHPVAAKCEREGVPCISTIEPWQAWFFGQNATPDQPFTYTYHFFDGIEAIAVVESDIWALTTTNKKVGVLWPNDADGAAFRDATQGYAALLKDTGYTFIDPGAYENGTKDFSSIIGTFKSEGVEVLAGVPTPPDFATFWTQAAQQGFTPKVATISKAILFPSAVASLPNNLGNGLSIASWWVPSYPYKSSLTGQTAQELTDAYESSPLSAGNQWNQGMAPNYALFEVANAVLSNTNPKDKKGVADQIAKTKVQTVLGPLDWTSGGSANPVKNVATIPMVGTQWINTDGIFDLVAISNTLVPALPLGGSLQVLA